MKKGENVCAEKTFCCTCQKSFRVWGIRLVECIKGWDEPTRCLMARGTVPGCPGSAHRPGRPPSPRCWPAPASGWLSHAGAGLSSRAAGLLVARTFAERGADSECDTSKVSLFSFPGRLCFQKKIVPAPGSMLSANTELQLVSVMLTSVSSLLRCHIHQRWLSRPHQTSTLTGCGDNTNRPDALARAGLRAGRPGIWLNTRTCWVPSPPSACPVPPGSQAGL